MKLVIVSGLSGSGKTVALHVLEDLGFYCIDNLPISLLQDFALEMRREDDIHEARAAAGIDARNRRSDLERFGDILDALRTQGIDCEVFFLHAEAETLLKRFSETRRRHPLARGDIPLSEAIEEERRLLEPIVGAADLHIDTTRTTMHQLRDLVRERVQRTPGTLSLLFQSFGYKHGVPGDADFVFDTRCLPNPHWEPELRALTGLDREVIEFLERHRTVEDMYSNLRDFLDAWIPQFEKENRSYMTVAMGCTGGQHRSVYFAERLARHFRAGYAHVLTRHRELS
ncbi:MAG: RNase adapter RapZ [Gammaproteobacteria bacterium]|nr:RNase adapter RapZ [Gammaproteobacteria bacterium]NIR82889.1 RNase adapter RapZ [Gammaproteobacteria bacterium]NIR90001.1 RNase adapter RapZ [Gammaproteobacteria bacterium]NIU03481.1 RNase adapter RapZ [Gammaproteobacteria bacterium]NIV51000.1 RNase adapter RapZ [Gammaproteobacteria bacterium]